MPAYPYSQENAKPRQQRGIPVGGQFANKTTPEAHLPQRRSRVKDGSYAFPPLLRNAEEIVEFWETVEVPDTVCEQITVASRSYHRRQEVLAEREKPRFGKRALAKWEERFAPRLAVPLVRDDQARDMARIRGMMDSVKAAPVNIQDEVRGHVTDCGFEQRPVGDVYEEYRLDSLADDVFKDFGNRSYIRKMEDYYQSLFSWEARNKNSGMQIRDSW